ncbi:pyruvate ferredoxin oxidoreductase, partial [candidate division WOR-3 bacterium]|nr:pyruvate ferredoxin oxidoreductase [candidate division WOR-3 bacterium]
MMKVIMGNHALSYGAKLSRVQVIAAYPITPQTQVVELLSEMCANGELDAKFVKVESEHSAMAASIGASAVGVRAFTATSSQGLALMHEMIHWAAGARTPIVLGNINRAMGPPWSIWTEQNDSLSERDTGIMQVYCESNQEVQDTVIQSFRVAENVLLPCMVVLDAFYLSHTYEPVDIPEQSLVDEYLPAFNPPYRL